MDDSPVVLAEAVLRLLTALAGGRGGVLVLEDLHWADPESLGVVEYLADNSAGNPVVCLGTIRSDEASAGLELARGLHATPRPSWPRSARCFRRRHRARPGRSR